MGRHTIVGLMLILVTTTSALAIECRSQKEGNSYWSWRLIDGKRCWYPGHGRIEKSRLNWAAEPKAAAPAPLQPVRQSNLSDVRQPGAAEIRATAQEPKYVAPPKPEEPEPEPIPTPIPRNQTSAPPPPTTTTASVFSVIVWPVLLMLLLFGEVAVVGSGKRGPVVR